MLIWLLFALGFEAAAMPAARLNAPALTHKASFQETYNRYPSPFGFIQILKTIVPYSSSTFPGACEHMTEQTAPVTGAIDPLQGSALEEEPGALFYPYFEKCIRDLSSGGFYANETADKNMREIMGDEFIDRLIVKLEIACKKEGFERPSVCYYEKESRMAASWYASTWKSLKDIERLDYMKRFIGYLAGPDAVLRRQKMIGKETAFGIPLMTTDDLAKFLSGHMTTLKDGESDLSVLSVYLETAILLRLGPALKN